MRRFLSASFVILFLPLHAAAVTGGEGVFPDIPLDHPFHDAIERLAGLGVIHGNPDGKFHGERTLNRAELLTMLYRALSLQPSPPEHACFRDIAPAAWYSAVVCDAVIRRFVNGYADGTFQPARNVSRAEAVKMILNAFGIPVPELTAESRAIVKFTDVSQGAWYTKYLYAGFTSGILPIVGQEGPRFSPDMPLRRDEAAAYIFNGLAARAHGPQSRSSAASAQSSDASQLAARATQVTSSSTSSPPQPPAIKNVSISFDDEGIFASKNPVVYRFTVGPAIVVGLTVRGAGDLSCRLLRIETEGYALEYYLGFEEKGSCSIRAALTSGVYQMEIDPPAVGDAFTITGEIIEGDGNDGFGEAKTLTVNAPRTGVLEIEDNADWFTFTVTQERELTLELSSTVNVSCIINPMKDVDIFGFAGPECNAPYLYPKGTYVVGVGHKRRVAEKYTIRLK